MRDFSKVSPSIWRSERFLNLGDVERLLLFYFLTCDHQNSAGTYRLPAGYACTDLGWPDTKYVQARETLIKAGLIAYDEKESIVAIPQWFEHNPPMNAKHYKGIITMLGKLPQVPCVEQMQEAVNSVFMQVASPSGISMEPAHEQTNKESHTHLLETRTMKNRR